MRKLRLLDQSDLTAITVVPAEEVQAIAMASKVIDEAHAWAERRQSCHEQELKEQRKEAYDAGFEEGFAAFLAGRDAYLNAATQITASLEDLLRTSLQRILGELPSASLMQATLEPILSDIRQQGDITVSVHPNKIPDLRRALHDLGFLSDRLDIVGSPELLADDCIIYTESSVINISIHVIVDKLVDAVAGLIQQSETSQVEMSDG